MAKTVEELEAQIATLKSEHKAEIEVLTNKGIAVEQEREKNNELKDKITLLEADAEKLKAELEEAKTNWAKDASSFKELYEEKKVEVETLKAALKTSNDTNEELKTLKEQQDAKISEDIEKLYEWVPEDQLPLVKDMAWKYPIESRIGFITDFTKQFIWKSKKQWGKPNWHWDGKTGMEKAQELYDELKAKPIKTEAEKKQFLKLGKILAWEIKIDD